MTLRRDVDLRSLNSFGVAARAFELLDLEREDQLPDARAWLDGRSAFILGGGSNLLLTRDLAEPVIHVALRGRRCLSATNADQVLVEVAAGESWHELVDWTLAMGFQGLENLAWIPGTVGAAPIQNIGAYGVELVEVFEHARVYDLEHGRWRILDRTDCQFGYRDSLFKRSESKHLLICSVTLRLRKTRTGPCQIDYGDLRAEVQASRVAQGLTAFAQDPSPQEVAQAVIAIRKRRLPDPARLGNAGSFFRNPIVGRQQALVLQERYPGLPAYPAPPRPDGSPQMKLAAAWLIERAGWKGVRHGDAGVHDAHALVLVNHGSASGADIRRLAQEIQDELRTLFDLTLEIETRVV